MTSKVGTASGQWNTASRCMRARVSSPRGPAPLLGQHNREVAQSLGYSENDIDTMEATGVLYAEPVVKKLST